MKQAIIRPGTIPAINSFAMEIPARLARRMDKALGGISMANPPLPITEPMLIGFLYSVDNYFDAKLRQQIPHFDDLKDLITTQGPVARLPIVIQHQ